MPDALRSAAGYSRPESAGAAIATTGEIPPEGSNAGPNGPELLALLAETDGWGTLLCRRLEVEMRSNRLFSVRFGW